MNTTELVARAVVADTGKVLLVRRKARRYSFLPGGHIEFGEGAVEALIRELREELGVKARVAGFFGCIEHSWEDSEGPGHEINLIFRVTSDILKSAITPPSLESHLEFFWHCVDDLSPVEFEPSALARLLPVWISSGVQSRWGSTISLTQIQ